MDAATLNCPSCGGAVSKDSARCQYCGALLQTVACPACLGMMFRGSKFCPHCGVAAAPARVGSDVPLVCPRCQVVLKDVQVGRQRLQECPHCGGMWVDSTLFEQICNDAEAQTAAIGLQLPPAAPLEDHVRYLKCPQCGRLMGRLNYAHRSGVIIDVCRNDGIWIDRDGLRQIIEFIRAGGLQRAREQEKADILQRQRRLDEASRSVVHGESLHYGDDVLPGVASLVWRLIR